MKKKLLLINPAPLEEKVISAAVLNLPPLTLGYIAALTPDDWEVVIEDEAVSTLSFDKADLVGLTAFTFNAPRAYEIAQKYRQMGIPCVMGGIHASLMTEEALNYVDTVVAGEAETIWSTVIRDFENGKMKKYYNGDLCSMESMVIPRRELFKNLYLPVSTIQTARGCPMACDFCSVTLFNGGSYRQRPVEDVLNELEQLDQKTVFFIDDNILGYGRKAEKRALELFKGMLDRNIKIRWASQSSINITRNPEVLKYAAKSGCFMLLVGFESINQKSLEGMNKTENLKENTKMYSNVINRFHDHGISIMGAFIVGTDYDDKSIFDRTAQFVIDSKIDMANFSILCPFPKTKLYDRLASEGRLLYTNYPNDWKYYKVAAQHVLYKPKHMTPDELLEGTMKLYKDTTSFLTCGKRAINTFLHSHSMVSTIYSFNWNRNMNENIKMTG